MGKGNRWREFGGSHVPLLLVNGREKNWPRERAHDSSSSAGKERPNEGDEVFASHRLLLSFSQHKERREQRQPRPIHPSFSPSAAEAFLFVDWFLSTKPVTEIANRERERMASERENSERERVSSEEKKGTVPFAVHALPTPTPLTIAVSEPCPWLRAPWFLAVNVVKLKASESLLTYVMWCCYYLM